MKITEYLDELIETGNKILYISKEDFHQLYLELDISKLRYIPTTMYDLPTINSYKGVPLEIKPE